MSLFTNHLKKEAELIRLGLGLFEAFSKDFAQGKEIPTEDMRMAVFAMQTAFETSHLAKEESILYPALKNSREWKSQPPEIQNVLELNMAEHQKSRNSLLELRLGIDIYDQNSLHTKIVTWCLEDLISHLTDYLEKEENMILSIADQILNSSEQKNLLQSAQKFELAQGIDQLRGSRLIFNRLRKARGMTAA
jgi:hemerythrin-like domain-containing protein